MTDNVYSIKEDTEVSVHLRCDACGASICLRHRKSTRTTKDAWPRHLAHLSDPAREEAIAVTNAFEQFHNYCRAE